MAKKKSARPRALTLNPGFVPCTIEVGEEYFPNGIFVFNITKLIRYIDLHRELNE